MQFCEEEEEEAQEQQQAEQTEPQESTRWTAKEKKLLLRLLQRYGSNNVTVISKYFPKHSVASTRRLIRMYRIIADHMYEDKLIDEWLSCGLYKPGSAEALGHALKLIGLFEERPSSGGVDYREIYLFLSSLLLSKDDTTVPLISGTSLRLIFRLLGKLEDTTWPQFEPKLFDYLSTVYKKRNIHRDYQGITGRTRTPD